MTGARLRDILRRGAQQLETSGVPGARRDAEWLLGAVLGLSRGELYLAADDPVHPERQARFASWCKRRSQREPLQYILGSQPFRDLDLLVDRHVLIPRPETECIVDLCLRLWRDEAIGGVVVDVGTGSGAIALSLAVEHPGARIIATDISAAALALAQRNIARAGAAGVSLVRGDLFEPFRNDSPRCGLIVCNPPYVAAPEIDGLDPEVREWEPRLALDGGVDGLCLYRRLAARAAGMLKPGAWIVLELGAGQRRAVEELFTSTKAYDDMVTVRDQAGIERGLALRRVWSLPRMTH